MRERRGPGWCGAVERVIGGLSVACLVVFWLVAVPAAAQPSGQAPPVLEGVGMDEQLGETVPGDLVFRNERGETVTIGQLVDAGRPVLLHFVYHNCPMLCNVLLDGLTGVLRQMDWTPGQEFDVVTVSFAADETPDLAARQKERQVKALGRLEAGAGWHFLTGSETAIQALAAAVGFQFRWDEQTQQYAHPAALIFLSDGGRITRYLYGLSFAPRDVRTALVEASEGRVSNPLDRVLLFCYQYDPAANGYVLQAQNLMKAGGLLTMLVLGGLLFVFWRREKQNLDHAEAAGP